MRSSAKIFDGRWRVTISLRNLAVSAFTPGRQADLELCAHGPSIQTYHVVSSQNRGVESRSRLALRPAGCVIVLRSRVLL